MPMLAQLATMGGAPPAYIEDVFSTWLYTGNGSTQTITNGIDLAGKGGMVWIKGRSGATDHGWYDTARGATFDLVSNSTTAQTTQSTGLTSFRSSGFSLGALAKLNTNAATYASWTFRKQPKFFDVVTYTGNGANRTIAHNLGSVPGCIIVKRTDTTSDWQVYHRSLANTQYMVLNSTAAVATGATRWNSTTPTSTVFSLGTDATVNASGGTYVAYIYAHDAGGFGASGTDNVISCGSCSSARVELGFEPQWIFMKEGVSSAGFWFVVDNMRGMALSSQRWLLPNATDAEFAADYIDIDATGFTPSSFSTANLYIAIRRGPMRTPTTGTSVFSPVVRTGTGSAANITGLNFPPDLFIGGQRSNFFSGFVDRLRGYDKSVYPYGTFAEATSSSGSDVTGFLQNGISVGTDSLILLNGSGQSITNYFFQRAPSFFDEVCYTGTGSNTTQTHNLGAVPELMIVKKRVGPTTGWRVYASALANTECLVLNTTAAKTTDATSWNSTTPTSSVFSIGTAVEVNAINSTYVAYLFATCPGVSKVGSFTGTGATQVINCGFTAGARFVLIKATSATGSWYVWDSARGIVAGNDPYLLLNSTAAEVTTTDWADTAATGFELSNAGGNLANSNGVSYIFLAIA